MGYKKTIEREPISGLFQSNDITDSGTYSVNELKAKTAARQEALNNAHKADWPKDMLSSNPESTDKALGNAFSRLPKPSDAVVGSQCEHYGADTGTAPVAKGGEPQKNAKVAGVPTAKNRG